jgi:hypothetical protein
MRGGRGYNSYAYTYWVYPSSGKPEVDDLVSRFKIMQLDQHDSHSRKIQRRLGEAFSDREMGYESVDILNEKFGSVEVDISQHELVSSFSSLEVEGKLCEVKGHHEGVFSEFKKKFGFDGVYCDNGNFSGHVVTPCANCTRPICKHLSYAYGYEPCYSCGRKRTWKGVLIWMVHFWELREDQVVGEYLKIDERSNSFHFLKEDVAKDFAERVVNESGCTVAEISVVEGPVKMRHAPGEAGATRMPDKSTYASFAEEWALKRGIIYFYSSQEAVEFMHGNEFPLRKRQMRYAIDRANKPDRPLFKCPQHSDQPKEWNKRCDEECLGWRFGEFTRSLSKLVEMKNVRYLREWAVLLQSSYSQEKWVTFHRLPNETFDQWTSRAAYEGFHTYAHSSNDEGNLFRSDYPIPGRPKLVEGVARFIEQRMNENWMDFLERYDWITTYRQLFALGPVHERKLEKEKLLHWSPQNRPIQDMYVVPAYRSEQILGMD